MELEQAYIRIQLKEHICCNKGLTMLASDASSQLALLLQAQYSSNSSQAHANPFSKKPPHRFSFSVGAANLLSRA